MKRRGFLKAIGGVAGAVALGSSVKLSNKTNPDEEDEGQPKPPTKIYPKSKPLPDDSRLSGLTFKPAMRNLDELRNLTDLKVGDCRLVEDIQVAYILLEDCWTLYILPG